MLKGNTTFERNSPVSVFIYYACVVVPVIFTMNPVIIALSLIGSIISSFAGREHTSVRFHIYMLILFVVMTAANPLFYHNGETVLFVMNNNPITLEAAIYGAISATAVISVLYRSRSYTLYMTSDRLLYLFSILSSKAALILTMALRYVPLYTRHTRCVADAQRAAGLYKERNIIDDIKGGMRVFSATATWALEYGIVTAASMEARGYGVGRRTRYSPFTFGHRDIVLTAISLMLFAVIITAGATGSFSFTFYPRIEASPASTLAFAAYTSYGVLSFLPAILTIIEDVRWKYLVQKI